MQASLTSLAIALLLSISGVSAAQNDVDKFKALLKEGDHAAVIDHIEKIPEKSMAHYELLVSAYARVDLDDAETAAEQAIASFPDKFEVYLQHASIMGAQASDSILSAMSYAKKAKKSLIKAVELAPDNVTTLSALMTFYVAAPSIAGGDMEEAKKLVATIKQIDPVEGQFNEVRYLRSNDKADDAAAILLELSQVDNAELRAFYQLGSLYSAQEDYDKAVGYFQKASEMSIAKPDNNADQDSIDEYESLLWQQAYATYSIGRTAIDSKVHDEQGIVALRRFLTILKNAEFSTNNLPSTDWTRLRLTELQLNIGDAQGAQKTFDAINMENDKNFKKIYKKLKRKL